MTNGDRSQLENELRQQLQQIVVLTRPYANSSGHFHDIADVGVMLALVETALQRAKDIHQRLKQP